MVEGGGAVVVHRVAGEVEHTAGKAHILILEADHAHFIVGITFQAPDIGAQRLLLGPVRREHLHGAVAHDDPAAEGQTVLHAGLGIHFQWLQVGKGIPGGLNGLLHGKLGILGIMTGQIVIAVTQGGEIVIEHDGAYRGGGMGLDGKDHNGLVRHTKLCRDGLFDGVCIGLFDADGIQTDDAHRIAPVILVNTGLGKKPVADKTGGAVFAVGGAAQMHTLPGSDIGGAETGQNGTGGRLALIHGQFLLFY